MRSSGSKRRSSAFGGSKTALSAPLGEFYPWEALTQQGTGAAGAPQPGVARSRVSRGEVAGAALLVHGWPCALHVAASTARSTLHTPELPRQRVSPQQNPNAALREPHGSPKTSTRCTGPSSMCPFCPCCWCPDKCWVCSGQSKNPATEGPQPTSGPKLCKSSALWHLCKPTPALSGKGSSCPEVCWWHREQAHLVASPMEEKRRRALQPESSNWACVLSNFTTMLH